jgi:4,5-DOPA dioxygenase extradiol
MTMHIPPVFISHGSPMFALERGQAADMLSALGRQLPRPKAILVASGHWDTRSPAVSTTTAPATIHDFYGFPAPLYKLSYTPPGAAEVAVRAAALLRAAGIPCAEEATRGLDHGAWVPLLFMYPQADIPVAQIAIQTRLGPAAAMAVGRLLAPLADEGVLLMGSGSITHNFQELDAAAPAGYAAPWVNEFVDWMAQQIAAGNEQALLDYRKLAPHGAKAHPSEDHLVPLHFALGAAACRGRRLSGGVTLGSLSMDSFVFDGSAA